MNFYASQDRARKTTRWLVLSTLLALVFITFISSWVLLVSLRMLGIQSSHYLPSFYSISPHDWPMFASVATFIVSGALISAYIKARELSKGGQAIATSLGGQKILANTQDPSERKALNVVEEMAIASGMPTPEVYVLQEEDAINAFAAGLTPTDAVIGLTQGAIEKLTRSQLQGVVGHEFSHILNGDMRLNSRLIMLVTGIEFVGLIGRVLSGGRHNRTGSFLTRRSRGKSSGGLVMVGVALRLIGWLGGLFGRMIQAAVSRQREYLADASAVQFTRNPVAVADALKVIGGEQGGARLLHTDSSQFSHLFFGQVFQSHLNFMFATHPPLPERIQLLQPSWDGQYLEPLPPLQKESTRSGNTTEFTQSEDGATQSPQDEFLQTLTTVATAATLANIGGLASEAVLKNPLQDSDKQALGYASLLKQAQEPNEAVGLVLGVLLRANFENALNATRSSTSPSDQLRDMENRAQGFIEALKTHQRFPGLELTLLKWFQQLEPVSLEQRLTLIERSLSALKGLSDKQYQTLKQLMQHSVDLDQQADIYEQTVLKLVTRFLDVHFGLAKPYKVHYKKIAQVEIQVRLLLSMLAFYGHDSQLLDSNSTAKEAFEKGLKACGLPAKPWVAVNGYSDNDFNHATEKLAHGSLKVKNQIMLGLQACIEHDGEIAEVERELILAIAATMDAPIPRLTL